MDDRFKMAKHGPKRVTLSCGSRSRYIAFVAALYVFTFLGVFVLVDEWPVYPPILAAVMVTSGSLIMAWAGTVRMMQIWPHARNRFALPSLAHATVMFTMLVAALTV